MKHMSPTCVYTQGTIPLFSGPPAFSHFPLGVHSFTSSSSWHDYSLVWCQSEKNFRLKKANYSIARASRRRTDVRRTALYAPLGKVRTGAVLAVQREDLRKTWTARCDISADISNCGQLQQWWHFFMQVSLQRSRWMVHAETTFLFLYNIACTWVVDG